MRTITKQQISFNGRRVNYRLVRSNAAKKLRVRVGISGVEVLQPITRAQKDVTAFLKSNEKWIVGQLVRVERLRDVRKPSGQDGRQVMFRGKPTPIHIKHDSRWKGANRVFATETGIQIVHGHSHTAPTRSLENWLRRQARTEIEKHLAEVAPKLKRKPNRVYVMGQRTKWGNCSSKRNLSFNWRLIMAPAEILRYIVIHELAHLVEPYHSAKFWFIVKSHCTDFERHKAWLRNHQQAMMPGQRI